jgi:hypothetical protein
MQLGSTGGSGPFWTLSDRDSKMVSSGLGFGIGSNSVSDKIEYEYTISANFYNCRLNTFINGKSISCIYIM